MKFKLLFVYLLTASLAGFSQPVINSFTPTNAVSGSVLTITGSGFNAVISGNIVSFGMTKAPVISASATQLVVKVPAASAHGPLSVLNTGTGLTAYSSRFFQPRFQGGGAAMGFAAKRDFTLDQSVKVILRDLNDDDKPDMVAAHRLTNYLTYSRNTSSPKNISFDPPVLWGTSLAIATFDIAVGDLNGDGKPDVVATDTTTNSISVFLNTSNGSISLAPRVGFTTSSGPSAVCIADIDNDGKPDIITTNFNTNTISFFKNTSAGNTITFNAKTDFATESGPSAICSADFDGDGMTDLAVANRLSGTVSFFRNTSSGSVSFARTDVASSANPGSIVAGDMDADDKIDVILGKADSIEVISNTSTPGSILFTGRTTLSSAALHPSSVSVADFNGDGKPDIAAVHDLVSSVSVTKNTTASPQVYSFDMYLTYASGFLPAGIFGGDADGDGKPDLFVANSGEPTVSTLRNTTGETVSPPPTITSFAPLSIGTGGTLTVTGSNFSDVLAIKLGGTNAATFQVLSSTELLVKVGTGASGTLSITTATGTAQLGGFTYVPAPTITSFAPTAALSGATVTITGTNLSNATNVAFGGTAAVSFSVLSSTTVIAVVGTGSSGSLSIVTSGGTATLAGFTYQQPAAPVISSFTPTSGGAGSKIVIKGFNFTGATAVKFGGINASSFSIDSTTGISAIINSGSISGTVSVTTPGGTATLGGFIIYPAPTIASFDPQSAATGGTITITGTNLTSTTKILFGGTQASSFTVISSTQLLAVVSNGSSGIISVTTTAGSADKTGFIYIPPPPPTITSFTPTSASTGGIISVTGTNFNGITAVSFGGTAADSFRVLSPTVLLATVRNGSSGILTVTGSYGSAGLGGFTYVPTPPPTITSFTPSSATIGSVITITGTNLNGANPTVFFGGTAATSVRAISATTMTAVVGYGSTGSLSVTTAGGTAALSGFVYNPSAPMISSFSPTTGIPGTTLTVYGTSLNGTTAVSLGGTPVASFTIVSPTTLTAVVANGSSGSLSVTTSAGSASLPGFTYFASQPQPPTITSFTPTSASAGATITITGTNLEGVSAVSFGNTAVASFQMISSTLLTAVLGNGSSDTVRVSAAGGIAKKSGFTYISSPAPPTITSFTPTSGTAGTAVTITGTNFTNVTSVNVGKAAAASYTVLSPTTIVAIVGNSASDSVRVITPAGRANANDWFTYINTTPVITSFEPLVAVAGATLTVTGINLSGVISATLGGTAVASFKVLSSTKITVVAGNGSSGALSITTTGGTAALSGFSYVTDTSSAIIKFSPISGPIGASVIITGHDFSTTKENNIVYFGAVKAIVTYATTGLLQVTVPPGATYQPVTIINKTTGVILYSSQAFDVTFPSKKIDAQSDFAQKLDIPTASYPRNVLFSDLDGDGKSDMIIGCEGLPVFKNIASPGSISSASFSKFNLITGPASQVIVQDIDGDGKPDILVANTANRTVDIYKNISVTGTLTAASFASPVILSTQNLDYDFAVGDLDGDGKPDIVTGSNGSNMLSVYRNQNVPGTISASLFASPVNFTCSTRVRCIMIRDLDSDGKPEIVVGNGVDEGVLSILKNNCTVNTINNSSFATSVNFAVDNNPAYMDIADLDGDGKLDIVLSSNGNTHKLSILRNTGIAGVINTSSFASKVNITAGTSDSDGVSVADVDGDGKPEIVTANYDGGMITILRNISTSGILSTSSFEPFIGFPAGPGASNVAIGDIDGDGMPDMAATYNLGADGIAILRNTSSLPAPPSITSFTPAAAAAGATLTVTGINLSGIISATLGGTSVASFKSLSSTALTLVVGNGSSGTLSITTAGGTATLTGFTFTSPSAPTITSFTPLSAATGQTITITGTNLSGTSAISLGGAAVASFKVLSSTTVEAVVGSGTSGTLRITTSSGNTDKAGFIYISPPVITSFEPVGAAKGETITITGTGFTGTLSVTLGGLAASSFKVINNDQLTLVVGDGYSGAIRVTNLAGSASLSGFVYGLPVVPNIYSVDPRSAGTGDTIIITGTNLTGTSSLTLGGTAVASFNVLSSTRISAIVGNGTTGDILITAAGGSNHLIDGFTYITPQLQAPSITSFTPGSAGAGATITVTGTNLSGVLSVTLGGVPAASFKSISATLLTLVVGNGASGSLAINKSTNSTSKAGFIFIPAVTISSDTTFCKGNSVVITSSASSGNQWYKNNVLIPGATAATYTATTTGVYKVIMKLDSVSYPSINQVTLAENAQPVSAFTITGDSSQCLTGNLFTFTNTSTIGGNDNISSRKWIFGDSLFSDLQNITHTYKNAGSYQVKLVSISNRGCRDTTFKNVLVKNPPSVVITNPSEVCNLNNNTTIDITTGSIVTGSAAGLVYTYWKDSSAITSLTNAAAVSASGIYYIKGTDPSSCYTTKPVLVKINPLPALGTILGDTTICLGTSVVLSNSTKGGVWSSSNTVVATIDSSGKVSTLTAGISMISYSYTSTSTGCSNSVTVKCTVLPLPITGKPLLAGYNSDTLTCFFNSVTIASKNVYDKYLWSNGATGSAVSLSANASVSLKVGSNQNSCYSESSVVVTARKNLTAEPVISRTTFDSLGSSGSGSYKWLFNNKLTGDTTQKILIGLKGIYNVSTSIDKVCWNTSKDYLVFFDPVTIKKTFDLIVYPNPTNGIFSLQLKFQTNTTAVIKITISDQAGIIKWDTRKLIFSSTSIKIPVNLSLAKGTYVIKVDVNGEINTQQLVVM